MQLQKYEVDALVSEIGSGKLKKSGKTPTISNVKLQAFLKRPASVQHASVQDLYFDNDALEDGQQLFADALLQFADATNEIGAKAQACPHLHPPARVAFQETHSEFCRSSDKWQMISGSKQKLACKKSQVARRE